MTILEIDKIFDNFKQQMSIELRKNYMTAFSNYNSNDLSFEDRFDLLKSVSRYEIFFDLFLKRTNNISAFELFSSLFQYKLDYPFFDVLIDYLSNDKENYLSNYHGIVSDEKMSIGDFVDSFYNMFYEFINRNGSKTIDEYIEKSLFYSNRIKSLDKKHYFTFDSEVYQLFKHIFNQEIPFMIDSNMDFHYHQNIKNGDFKNQKKLLLKAIKYNKCNFNKDMALNKLNDTIDKIKSYLFHNEITSINFNYDENGYPYTSKRLYDLYR